MEGGLVDVDGLYHLLCVVSIINPKGAVYTGLSKKLPLPITVSDNVKNGAQFGVEIRKYEKDIIMNGTDEQKKLRTEAIEKSTFEAASVPAEVIKNCREVIPFLETISKKGNQSSLSDAGVAIAVIAAAPLA